MTKNATVNCVVCGTADVKVMGGHVHKGDETVFAHTCHEHEDDSEGMGGRKDCKGCFGEWTEEMGVQDSGFKMGFIDRDGFNEIPPIITATEIVQDIMWIVGNARYSSDEGLMKSLNGIAAKVKDMGMANHFTDHIVDPNKKVEWYGKLLKKLELIKAGELSLEDYMKKVAEKAKGNEH